MDDLLDRRRWLPTAEDEEETASFRSLLEEEPEERPGRQKRPSAGLMGVIGGLSPWQRFVLALLLFLNVALLGCMCLVMTGRVVPVPP